MNRIATRMAACLAAGACLVGATAPAATAATFAAAPAVVATVDVDHAAEFARTVVDGVDFDAIAMTIPGMDELKLRFNETATAAHAAYPQVVKAEKSVERAARAANDLRALADQPMPGTVSELAAHGKALAAAALAASDTFAVAKADVDTAYAEVVDVRGKATATIEQAKVVRANAEAILRDPASSPATREAAMDALAVIGANLAENERFVEIADQVLAKVAAVKAAAERAQKSIATAKAVIERSAIAQHALEVAANAVAAAAKNAVSAAKNAVTKVIPLR